MRATLEKGELRIVVTRIGIVILGILAVISATDVSPLAPVTEVAIVSSHTSHTGSSSALILPPDCKGCDFTITQSGSLPPGVSANLGRDWNGDGKCVVCPACGEGEFSSKLKVPQCNEDNVIHVEVYQGGETGPCNFNMFCP